MGNRFKRSGSTRATISIFALLSTSLLMTTVPSGSNNLKPHYRGLIIAQADLPAFPFGQFSGQTNQPIGIVPHSGKDFVNLRKLERATRTRNLEQGLSVLKELQNSKNAQTLLEVARTVFDRNGLFHAPETGFAVTEKIVTQNSELKGEAAFLAGRYYKQSPKSDGKLLAINWFEKAAQWGVIAAHSHLGDVYFNRQTSLRDPSRALYHYELAARQLSAAPIISFARKLARLKPHEEDCGIDPFKIASFYLPVLEQEAVSGQAIATKELGRLFLKGVFVDQSVDTARKWFQIAADGGDAGAMRELAKLYLRTPDGSSSRENAEALLLASANAGNAAAYSNLAQLYLLQNRPAADEKAIELYRKSVDAGYLGGLKNLRKIHDGEELLGQNPDRVERLASALNSLETLVAGYIKPQPDRQLDVADLTAEENPLIDTTVVGSIEGQSSLSINQSSMTHSDNEPCSYLDRIDQKFLYETDFYETK